MMEAELKELITKRVHADALVVLAWESDEDEGDGRERANLGRFVVVEDEGEVSEGPFEGEEGVLYASIVGAAKHDNIRVHYGLMVDGTDCPTEVDPYQLEAI
jgi:hypothetical protein